MSKREFKQRTQIRDIFGIIPIPIYTKSSICNVSCIYCPIVPEMPKSYLNNEDTNRARSMNYDPELQLDYWIKKLEKKYNTTQSLKLEIIILGGTFSDLDTGYRCNYFKILYDKLNGFKSNSLSDSIKLNGNAKFRACIITVETRPDSIDDEECDLLRSLGVSKVELGVQTIFDDVLKFSRRPYTRKDISHKTKLLKKHGFKIGYHIMLNMPKSDIDLDRQLLQTVAQNHNYSPDFIKIYPLTLIKNKKHQPELWKLFSEGVWKPYKKSQLLDLIYQFKIDVPEYIRIQRIQRQFDEDDYLYKGVELRNSLLKKIEQNQKKCSCIRCQEIALFRSQYHIGDVSHCIFEINRINDNNFYFTYKSSKKRYLLGYLKLFLDETAIVREIKVIGKNAMVGQHGQLQGRGIGSSLLKKAECFAHKRGYSELFVNASPGVRFYFYKKNYTETESGALLKKLL